MPLSSTSHRRTRSRVDANLSSPEPQITDSSPIRHFSKKRKIHETVPPKNISEDELQINSVIACLTMPNHDVMVAHDHANDKNARNHRDGVQAYAKLSGLNWTFYVRDLRVVLGRPPDGKPSGSTTTDMDVDIDLGPSKLVSRQHAVIEYDTNGPRRWFLSVTGRNGVKVDDEIHKRGSIVHLKSGNMLEIAGVQMLFFLPDQPPTFSPSLLKKVQGSHPSQQQDEALHAGSGSVGMITDHRSDRIERPPSSKSLHLMNNVTEGGGPSEPSGSTKNFRPVSASFESPTQDKTPAAYHRGLMLESTEDVDYSNDSSKEIKPPYSYATLIAQAILSSEDEKLTLAQIYTWIQEKYAFYRHAATGWQNSIRHNLSLNKAFQKIPRRTDEPGKGMKWQIAEESREEYTRRAQKPSSKGGKSSQPSSPVSESKGAGNSNGKKVPNASAPPSAAEGSSQAAKISTPRSITPPPQSFSRINHREAFTPDRGSRNHTSARTSLNDTNPRNENGSSKKVKSELDENDTKPPDIERDEPPSPSQAKMPSSPFVQEYSSHSLSTTAITPAPQRQHPLLAPPSTNQLPSSYMPTSSPAPFWKYLNMSTPARGEFSSPVKSPLLQSSSPPPAAMNSLIPESSPTKERSMLAGTKRVVKGLPFGRNHEEDTDDVGDLEGVDLSKGKFEKIGKFHANQAARRVQVADAFRRPRFKR